MPTELLVLVSLLSLGAASQSQPPNIILILADDLGWNDVGFHGSNEIPTPNIDALAYHGVILNQHYAPALCTPSRAALLTGRYPIHTGMQHLVILESEPWGLGLGERLLPELLASEAGYATHAVGKWHLGFYRKEHTPTYRGFQSHFGYWQGFHDYYNHSVKATYEAYDGYDMRRNMETDWSAHGHYSTDLFTQESVRLIKSHDKSKPLFLYLAHLAPHSGNERDPFQAPDSLIARFSHIRDPERRVYAAMVSKLDESVGEVVTALRESGMLENSVIIFSSDNGAPTHGIHSNRGSNYPLRGMKNSAWEGGNRVAAAVWSPLIKHQQRVSDQLMYMTDWFPTLASLAGIKTDALSEIDGVDMWESLSTGKPSPRTELIYNIDQVKSEWTHPYAALRKDNWKYVIGSSSGTRNNDWYGELESDGIVDYDMKSVMLSRAGVAISAFIIKNQIKEKASKRSALVQTNEGVEWRLLSESKILSLRSSARISCNANLTRVDCNPLESPCLFNLEEDPCERVNLASRYPHVLAGLENILHRYKQSMVPPRNIGSDMRADPSFWNNTWSCWHDELEKAEEISLYLAYRRVGILSLGLILPLLAIYLTRSYSPTRRLSIVALESFIKSDRRKGK